MEESAMFVALIMGIVAGLRAMTPLAAVSWAARLGVLHLDNTWLAFLGYRWTPWLFTLLALAEIFNDKLPKTPSRKVPVQFATRVITGAIAGAAIGTSVSNSVICALLGACGAVIGTFAGSAARTGLTEWSGGKGLLVALCEDCVAIGCAAYLLSTLV
jgi:uncharacterized membrane protein